MKYYDVAIGAEKHWKTSEFTYSSAVSIPIRGVVDVPFGKKKKVGVVTRVSAEVPKFATKDIFSYKGFNLSQKTMDFANWYKLYYNAKQGQVYSQLIPSYLTVSMDDHTNAPAVESKVKLNNSQSRARQEILSISKPSILHGITGSGKTRLYISLIQDCLAKGRSALLLYPEISLTPQILTEIQQHTPVVAFHSGMSNSERSRLWYTVARSDKPMVVIGPRSALFLPHSDLGLIIVDESHESTYKQDSDIRYNGLLAAGGLAKSHSAKLVLASATPPITETEMVLKSGGNLVCMHSKAIPESTNKHTTIIDKTNKGLFSQNRLVSDPLLESIRLSLSKSEQSLLFINRRGTAKITLCSSCDWTSICTDCDLPLTYHHDSHKMICHTCSRPFAPVAVCPECNQATQLRSPGSKAIVDEIGRLFPDAIVGRYDSDNSSSESLSNTYDKVRKGQVDILVGTQQIVKGLDLPLLSTMGILDADLSLHFPDYSSDERTFQLIAQASGRVSRGHRDGRVFTQTRNPGNKTLHQAKDEDWHAFRDNELATRKMHAFPPYVYVAKIIFRNKSQTKVYEEANKVKDTLNKHTDSNTTTEGPMPSFISKRGLYYYAQLHIRSKSRATILKLLKLSGDDKIYDLDPTTLL